MEFTKNILITGGAGFIGTHLVKFFVHKYPKYKIINLDKLTYAGKLENIAGFQSLPNYKFIKADVCNAEQVHQIFIDEKIDNVIHLAAETHVDNSILAPNDFVTTNVLGTLNILNAAKKYWTNNQNRFYQISTDEVYGTLSNTGCFTENAPYQPQSPYAASKASADHFVRAYHNTYGLNCIISNCSNNYGPNQYPEKLIPLTIKRILNNQSIPIYGNGKNVRDWLWVEDHVNAIDLIFHQAKKGETYNIGANNEWTNIELVETICNLLDEKLSKSKGTSQKLITFVKDRAGHDYRYAINATKLKSNLGWAPTKKFEEGLSETLDWYILNH